MYRCLECKTAFEYKPNYCECGNDTFEEAYEAPRQQQYTNPSPSPTKKKVYNVKEIASMAIFAICIILSILAWVFIGKDASKISKGADTQQGTDSVSTSNIPDINSIWDNTLPAYAVQAGKSAIKAKTKVLLNSKMKSLSSAMRSYVLTLGKTFVGAWPKGTVVGDGSCEIEFSVDKDGRIVDKKIYKASKNKTLDDSVALMMENVTQTEVPPADYKGESIIMAFSIQHREFKVYYPHY